jgi:Type I restriction enzyme R protein N terminus (HSDR_N)
VTAGSGEPDDNIYEQRTPRYAGFSESDLVEKPAINLFAELGWQTANLWSEFRAATSPEGRHSKREAFLPNRVRSALGKLNPDLTETALDEAYSALTRSRGAIDPIRANAELTELLRDGVKVPARVPMARCATRPSGSSTGINRRPTISCSLAKSGSRAISTPSGRTSSASSTACLCSLSN